MDLIPFKISFNLSGLEMASYSIENITCDTDYIWIFSIDLFHNSFCLGGSHAVAEMGISEKDYFQGIHAVNCFFNVYLIRCSFHMGYMKDSVNTEADDQYGADQACDDESAAVPDKRGHGICISVSDGQNQRQRLPAEYR